jgi:PAS domain S-box-containing protein
MANDAGMETRVLAQMLLMQSVVASLPDESIVPFVTSGLSDIPGVRQVVFRANAQQEEPSCTCFTVALGDVCYGSLVFDVAETRLFEPYFDQLSNFAFMLAVILGERAQRRINELNQQQLERQVQHRTAELAASERKYRELVENTPDIVTHVDMEGRYRFINKSGLELLGLTAQEAQGRLVFDDVHPDDREPTRRAFQGWLSSDAERLEFENRVTGADGRTHILLWNIRRTIDAENKTVEFNSIARDITKQREIEIRLHDSLKQLLKSNAELERFAYIASHDLREPIRTIIMFSQRLARQLTETPKPETQESMDFIISAAKRMDGLVNDLLAYSRVTHESQKFSDVDLDEILAEICLELKAVMESSQAVIDAAPLPKVPGVRFLLHQLLLNLISNAIKFKQEGVPPRIRIMAEREESGWHLIFADNGIGIDQKYADQIFVIFKRLHTAQAYPGTGVGLAICKRIMERHNGRIWVESQQGHGAAFHVFFPDHQIRLEAGMVEPRGIEPLTSSLRTRRSPN